MIKVPSPSLFTSNKLLKLVMEFFLSYLTNVNYYLGTIPFKVKLIWNGRTKEEEYDTEENRGQKVICRMLIGLSIFQGFFLVHGSYWGKIVQHPSVLFKMWVTVINGPTLGIIWAATVFNKGKQRCMLAILHTLLKRREAEARKKANKGLVLVRSRLKKVRKSLGSLNGDGQDKKDDEHEEKTSCFDIKFRKLCILLCILLLGVIFPISAEVVQVLNIDGEFRSSNLSDNFRTSSAQVLYDLFLYDNHTSIPQEEFGEFEISVSLVYLVIRAYGKIIIESAHLLSFFSALAAFLELRRCLMRSNGKSLGRRISAFIKARKLIQQINEVNRLILLCLVGASVPLFVLRLIEGWDTPQISIKIIVAIKLSQYLTIMIICGEVNYKANVLKGELLDSCHSKNKGKWSGRIFRSELALDVGRFAKVSFSYVGLLLSAYLSYAIMLLQFGHLE